MLSAPEEKREEDINTKKKEKKTRRSFQGRGSFSCSIKINCSIKTVQKKGVLSARKEREENMHTKINRKR